MDAIMDATQQFDAGWDEAKHPRAKDGKFGHGSGSSKAMHGLRAKIAKFRQSPGKMKAIARAPLHAEHAVKTAAKAAIKTISDLWKDSGAGYNKSSRPLDPDSIAGKTVNGVKFVGKLAMKTAFLPWIAGEKAVEGVARAKGLSDEEAAKVRTLVTCYDAMNCKAIVLGCHAAGMRGLAAASVWFPTASMAYLAHATAKDFPAVQKAAAVGIRKAAESIGRTHKRLKEAMEFAADADMGLDARAREAVGALADAIKAHSGSDYYYALLANAMDYADSAPQAVALADSVFNRGRVARPSPQ
jgi:hypothetical protein